LQDVGYRLQPWSMVTKDPYQTAKSLMSELGCDAKTYAIERVFAMRAVDDECSGLAWLRVFDALLDLEARRPKDDQSVH
jgi:hypothetical protein